jgi:hypothetical protein
MGPVEAVVPHRGSHEIMTVTGDGNEVIIQGQVTSLVRPTANRGAY